MEKENFSIGEISKMYGIGLDSIRYYEEIGLISPKRTPNNYRYYDGNDISKLNVIRELLDSGFSTREIEEYFKDKTIDSTFDLLLKEHKKIEEKIKKLKKLDENVKSRIDVIKKINKVKFETIYEDTFKTRKFFKVNEGYSKEQDMNILIHRLGLKEKEEFYIIGNNQIGTVINSEEYHKNGTINYSSVFLFSKNGNFELSGGKFLRVFYLGQYGKTKKCIDMIDDYIAKNNLFLDSNYLEIIWADTHTTDNKNEYVTEVQVRVKCA